VPARLPLKEATRELIVEVLRTLEPYFPDIASEWRDTVVNEFRLPQEAKNTTVQHAGSLLPCPQPISVGGLPSYTAARDGGPAPDGRVLAALERLTYGVCCGYFCHGDFEGFFENLRYFGTRLAKLDVDTRKVARSLGIYQSLSEPYLESLFGEHGGEARAALEALSSATFVTVSGAYFDAKSQESAALLAVLDAELATDELSVLLRRVLEITAQTFGATLGLVLLHDDESELLRVCASVGLEDAALDEYTVRMGEGFSGNIALRGEPEMVLDASRDPRVQSAGLRRKTKSLWGVPLKAEGDTIGVLLIGFAKLYEWLPTERGLMRAIADRSALAIDRARITEALREREARIAELSAHLLRAQEEERKRISRELHDETGQALMVIRLYLGMLEASLAARNAKGKVRETLSVVDRTIDGIRRIIGRLSPLVLQELGLIAAIRKEAKHLAKNTGVKARVAISEAVGRLSPETETTIYRVVQEALHNVAKHAQAHTVSIRMGRDNGNVRLLVEDDGVGISQKNSSSRGHSFGLAGIKERVGMLGGSVRVISARGKGTRIEVSVPAANAGNGASPQDAAVSSGASSPATTVPKVE